MEIRLAISAIVIAVALALVVFVWRVFFDDAYWSSPLPMPELSGFDAFAVYAWGEAFGAPLVFVLIAIAAWRRRPQLVAPLLAILVSAETAVLYWPLTRLPLWRVDRLRGRVEEPNRVLIFLFWMLVLTLVTSVIFVCVAHLRHVRKETRPVALTTNASVNLLMLSLVWLFAVAPQNGWFPPDRQRRELLTHVRPCRGAFLLSVGGTSVLPFGRIDDLWLRFAAPRTGNAPVRAISVRGEFYPDYHWLEMRDLTALRVRIDDPAVLHCDGIWRRDLVHPAPWHHLGPD